MNIEKYNTIIIGAGVAGLSAARNLIESTLLIDRKKSIGEIVQCGEGISKLALERENIDIDKDWIATDTRQIQLIMPNQKTVGSIKSKPFAYVIKKGKFEKYLAQNIDHKILLSESVINIEKKGNIWLLQTSKGRVIEAKYLIGADGPNSIVAKKIFGYDIEKTNGIDYEIIFEKNIDTSVLQIYLGSEIIEKGYAWIFPYSKNSANIGILTKKNDQKQVYYSYEKFLHNIVEKKYGKYKKVTSKSGILPTGGFFSEVIKDNAMLVGDAGSFTDPIFEGGMNLALLTGRKAAEAININDIDEYQKFINSLPFSGQDLYQAQKILYNLSDETLNILGVLLENKGFSSMKTSKGLLKLLLSYNLFPDLFKLLKFAKIWSKAEDYLW